MATQQTLIDTDNVDLSTSNASCRILIVSPSPAQATALIRRIQALSSSTSSQIQETVGPCGKRDLLSPDLVKIPWTIENKYYSADVHFAVHPMRGLAPYLLQNIPAVIFVWRSDEAYKHHIERISRDLDGHEPEISLAVRVKPSNDEIPPEPMDEEEGEEDNASIDGFLSSSGFEYIDATLDIADRQEERKYEEKDDFDGIPSLPRVVDALSTIMWPSMKARDKSLKHGKAQLRRDPSLFEWGIDDGTLPSMNDLVPTSSVQPSQRMESEMDELTKWLENDVKDGDREDPWSMALTSSTMVASPTKDDEVSLDKFSSDASGSEQAGSSGPTDFTKFDDDFTVFVSAPAAEALERGSGHSTPAGDEFEYQDGLKPPGGLQSYNSLGSVSDFEGSDGGKDTMRVISDDEDQELPTRDEILKTSSRIFGKRGKPSSIEDSQGLQKLVLDEKLGDDKVQPDGDDEYDLAPFDLTRVLSALQQMKEDISGMENEDERRKAAARVALGLVYGLEAEGDI